MDGGRGSTRVVILGGGTAGWMTAVALATSLAGRCDVRLIESAEIGIVGVGEASLQHLRGFNAEIGIDETEFMAATRATFKLGINFRNWRREGDSYMHPFGTFGRRVGDVPFHHFWVRAQAEGRRDTIGEYSLPVVASRLARFAQPPEPGAPGYLQHYDYGYHFDATLYAPYLRTLATARGVQRTEGRVVDVARDGESGDLVSLTLENGETLAGDLFVDCSGFASRLLGHAMAEPFEDWSRWLPCDRAVAMPTTGSEPLLPYTQAVAMTAGWRWRIPLQHRTGNGYVYASDCLSDEAAADELRGAVDGDPLAEPRVLRFTAGRRRHGWVGNCVAIGLASGFLEPLESTSIYLVQAAIETLIALFPDGRTAPTDRHAFNHQIDAEYDRIRDFLILHYHATERRGAPFWDRARTMEVPTSLLDRIELFRRRGRLVTSENGVFREDSWLSVLLGQGVVPAAYDQRVAAMPQDRLMASLDGLKNEIAAAAEAMPAHRACFAPGKRGS